MNKVYIRSILFFILFICTTNLFGQKIPGVVIDSVTNEPIPYLSVYYEGKGVGSITDDKGHYSVETRQGWTKLTFSAVGYRTKNVTIIPGTTKLLDIKISPDDIVLQEVVIKPKRQKYSRKNNPAVEMMKKVIANKQNNKLEDNDLLQFRNSHGRNESCAENASASNAPAHQEFHRLYGTERSCENGSPSH